jgi:nucleotide-binding universal stress UspA family protein
LIDNQFVYFCRKSTDLSWEGDEPSTAVAEEEAAPPAEESTPASQAEAEAPATEATLPEASVVEGKYSAEAIVLPIE